MTTLSGVLLFIMNQFKLNHCVHMNSYDAYNKLIGYIK